MKQYLKLAKRIKALPIIIIFLLVRGVTSALATYNNSFYSKMISSLGTDKIYIFAKIFIGLEMLHFILDKGILYKDSVYRERCAKRIKDILFKHSINLTIKELEDTSSGKIINAASMSDSICNQMFWFPTSVLQIVVRFVTAYIILIKADYKLSFILLSITILSGIVSFRMQDKLKSLSTEKIKYRRKMIESFNNLRCFQVIKGFCREQHEINKFVDNTDKYMIASILKKRLHIGIYASLNFGKILIDVVIIAYLIYNNFSVEKGILFFTLVDNIYYPLFDIPDLLNNISEMVASIQTWNEIMDKDIEDGSGIELTEFNNSIQFKNVSCSYEKSDEVLSNINFKIKKGTKLGIYGPSGSGKSTFVNLITKFMNINNGEILIDGIPINTISNASIRDKIGIVSQDIYLFNDTIFNNIKYGNLNATEADVIEAAKKANIHEFITSLKEGYNSNIGNEGVKLSGGQKQRLSIARMFLANPDIIILDEATSKLDNESEKAVQKAIDNLEKGKTVISIAHRLSTLNNCDMLIGIDKHTIVERGYQITVISE